VSVCGGDWQLLERGCSSGLKKVPHILLII
jgi:hypothetical protein